jgi:acyl-CoA thioesterase-1
MSWFNDRLRARGPVLILLALSFSCSRERQVQLAQASHDAGAVSAVSSGAPPKPASAGPLVVFLGDSLAAGLHLPAEQAFPAVVQGLLARDGLPFRLVNAGVSGDTTAGGRSRLAWILKQHPRVVVLELGSNDGMRGLPLTFVEENLRAMIGQIRAQGADVLFLGMRLPPSFGGDYASGFADVYQRVAKDSDVAFVPFFHEGVAGVPELNLPDGIHPTEEGHRRIAARLAPHLAALLLKRDGGA